MQFLLSILIPHLFVLFSTSCNAEDSNWYGNTEVEATEQTNFHLDESIASPIVPGVGELSSLGTPALLLADNTAPLIASDETSCALPKENSQRRKKSRRNGLPNDACVAPMQLQASPPTEKKTNLRQRPGDTNKNPNSGAPGDRKAPHGGPLFESLSWIAPPTLRTGDGRCPDPDRNIPVCASEDDLAFVGIPLDLRFVYPYVHPCRPVKTRPWCCSYLLDNVMTVQDGNLVPTTSSSGMNCIPMYSDSNPRLPANSP